MSRYLKLLAELEKLDVQIERARRKELPGVIKQIRENLRLYRLTWSELLQTAPKSKKPRGRSSTGLPVQPRASESYARQIAARSVLGDMTLKDGEHRFSNSALIGAKPPLPLAPKAKGRAPQKSAPRKSSVAAKKAAAPSPRGTRGAAASGARAKTPAKKAPRKRK